MAAAEARAVWQRTANRCFVQEDAKRAPKLACCQSSSSSSKQVDTGPGGAADAPDQPTVGFMPLNRNPSYSNLPPDTRWWLQLQPNYGYQKGLTSEQVNALEAEMEALRADSVKPSKVSGDHLSDKTDCTPTGGCKSSEVIPDVHDRISGFSGDNDYEFRKQDVEALDCKTAQEFLELMDTRENYEFVEIDSIGCPTSKIPNEPCFDPESPWIGSGRTEPWWRTTDKDDLASLVAQKSHDYMANCDLPPPQKMHIRRYPYAQSGCFDHDNTSSLDWRSQTGHISNPTVHAQISPNSGAAAVEEGHASFGSDNSFRYSTAQEGITEPQASESDPCKAQLLEALRHSQTRAREAETAAKQAYAEKEHILKLFFRQASQLFAYKQWFQLLQLEALYLQVKNNDPPISTLFPVSLPWMPQKGRKLRKNWHKAAKGKRRRQSQPRNDMSKYAVAFALGLGLVGAGLLLGWTVGWMLPF